MTVPRDEHALARFIETFKADDGTPVINSRWPLLLARALIAGGYCPQADDDALKAAEEFAAEGWAWVDELLKLGGWSDVFKAQDALRRGYCPTPLPESREDAFDAWHDEHGAARTWEWECDAFFAGWEARGLLVTPPPAPALDREEAGAIIGAAFAEREFGDREAADYWGRVAFDALQERGQVDV